MNYTKAGEEKNRLGFLILLPSLCVVCEGLGHYGTHVCEGLGHYGTHVCEGLGHYGTCV